MLNALAFFELCSVIGKLRSGASSGRIAKSERSHVRTLVLTPSRQAGRQARRQAGWLAHRQAGRWCGLEAQVDFGLVWSTIGLMSGASVGLQPLQRCVVPGLKTRSGMIVEFMRAPGRFQLSSVSVSLQQQDLCPGRTNMA